MEQMNSAMMSMIQTVTAPAEPARAPEKKDSNDFQKLLEQKTQSAKKDGQTESSVKADKTKADSDQQQEAPVQEDAQLMVKRVVEGGLISAAFVADSPVNIVTCWEPVNEEELAAAQLTLTEGVVLETGPQTAGEAVPAHLMQQQPEVEAEAGVPTEAQPQATVVEEAPVPQPRQTVQTQGAEEQTRPAPEVSRQENADPQEIDVKVMDAEQAPRQLFEDVKAAPVKVGETYQPQQSEQADVAGQIDAGLAQALDKGESQVRLQLTPEYLGTVTVEISRSAEGILKVALSAHSSETRGLLERHAAHLQGLLASRTQQDVQVDVQRQQESQQSQNQNPYDGHNGHSGHQQGENRQQNRREQDSQNFFQQLRLGLVPSEEEST